MFLQSEVTWRVLGRNFSWEVMAAIPSKRFDDSLEFRQLLEEHQRVQLVGMGGAPQMVNDIGTAIPTTWQEPKELRHVAWMGAFTRTEGFIVVRGCTVVTLSFWRWAREAAFSEYGWSQSW